jgi:hypothetical protein
MYADPYILAFSKLTDSCSVEAAKEPIRPVPPENPFLETAAANEYLEREVDVGTDFEAAGNPAAVAATA